MVTLKMFSQSLFFMHGIQLCIKPDSPFLVFVIGQKIALSTFLKILNISTLYLDYTHVSDTYRPDYSLIIHNYFGADGEWRR